ncbi:hypothetical protein K1719_041380 [Acacia pycnantha]|nr:hypothetical protein K1719_041380 [Acacia pycnantha]
MPTAVSPLASASRLVAVIGVGASGLVAARELRREGHRVVVFERGDQVGGTWIYTPKVESDLLGDDRDGRRFPGHKEVLMYLQDFAAEFGINELVRFETEVVSAKLEDGGKWKTEQKVTSKGRSGDRVEEIYDALVVCNGHYTQPRIADIPGIKVWPRKQMHSHNYRTPDPFQDQFFCHISPIMFFGPYCRFWQANRVHRVEYRHHKLMV